MGVEMESLKQQERRAVKWSPRELWTPVMTLMVALMLLKLLLFDLLWCSGTSWSGMLDIRVYVRVILFSFILSIPVGMFRYKWLQVGVSLLVDAWCIWVLLQMGGDPACMPVLSRLLTDALPEPESAFAGLWFPGLLLPLTTTIAAIVVCLMNKGREVVPLPGKAQYCGYIVLWSLVACVLG